MNILQINLQHSEPPSAIVSRQAAVGQTQIALIQEPWVRRGAIQGLDKAKGIIYSSTHNIPRACIYVSKEIQATAIPDLCSRDVVAIKVSLKRGRERVEIVLGSVYLPYDSPTPPPSTELEELVQFCSNERLPLIIGCDANAHHTCWGSTGVNPRGSSLLQYLYTTDLEIINRGNSPTFVTQRRQEVIDITLGSRSVIPLIKNWQVSTEPSLSDHCHIRFNLDLALPVEESWYRNPRDTDWDAYRRTLLSKLTRVTQPRNIEEIETSNKLLLGAITASYESSCPLKRRKERRNVPWWNKELQNLRRETRRLCNRAMRSQLPEDWDNYKMSQRLYKSCIRNSKRAAWKDFCESIEDLPEAARLCKALKKDSPSRLETLRLPSGRLTSTTEECLRHLLETHFPESVVETEETPALRPPRAAVTVADWRTASRVVTVERVKWAFSTFDPYKSPGADGVFPALLQEGSEILTRPIYHLLRTCLALGYVPIPWRTVRVVFIPKAGRISYDSAKSYRAISLTSFLLKTLERLVERFVKDGALALMPLHPSQHAYQAGKSVETALHPIVSRIEKALHHKELAAGAFLDIEGAFDNTSFDSICAAAAYHGFEDTIIRWMRAMLAERKIIAASEDTAVKVSVRKGCPQGGVLSPLLWCLVLNGLLKELENEGIFAQGYADDIAIVISGKFPNTVSGLMQRALLIVQHWCNDQGLRVNPSKAELVVFTRRRVLDGFVEPVLYGTTLRISRTVKYLGVILDSKLTWKDHIERQVQRATNTLWVCRRTFGKTWGINPKVIMWYYTVIVRPMITYASVVWWPAVAKLYIQRKLTQLQRLACLGVTGAIRTTPTAALEVLLDLVPLHLVIKAEAWKAAYRLRCGGQWKGGGEHLGHTRALSDAMGMHPLLNARSDSMVPSFSFSKPFEVVIPKRDEWNPLEDMLRPADIVWFTDGSRTEEGAGAGIYGERPRAKFSYALGKYATVFQTEIFAILVCAQENIRRRYSNKHIYICSDSQAALKALAAVRTNSLLVQNCKQALGELGSANWVKLLWVPGHSNIEGNEQADALARGGSQQPSPGPEPVLGYPKANAKKAIENWARSQFVDFWASHPELRQAKLLISGPLPKRADQILRLSRKQVRTVVSFLTGHGSFRKHLHTIGVVNNPDCRFCGEVEETSIHLLTSCPGLMALRHKHFGIGFPMPEEMRDAPVGRILAFGLESGLNGETP